MLLPSMVLYNILLVCAPELIESNSKTNKKEYFIMKGFMGAFQIVARVVNLFKVLFNLKYSKTRLTTL
jgi:hypothetical protein